jgi:hypothetical protein
VAIWISLLALLAAIVGLVTSSPILGSGVVEIVTLLVAATTFILICAIEALH